MSDLTGPLVTSAWLEQHLGAVSVLDVRWAPSGPSPRERFAAGHVPGATRVDLDTELAGQGGPGRHPFPSPETLAALLSRLGVAEETPVVAVDDGSGAIAARLWFLLRVHGHARAAVLDGGFSTWRAEGRAVETGPGASGTPVALRSLSLDAARLADQAEILRRVVRAPRGAGPLLLDARAPERYRGEVEPLDAKAGHIPGAVNAPFQANLRSAQDPRFLPAAALRARYAALGAEGREVICSCGSGVTACHDILALELAGLPGARLYVGSWSEWSQDPRAPVATGEGP